MPPADKPTTSYEGTGTFRPAPPVPSAVGPGGEPGQEFRDLLRRRLITIAIISLFPSGIAAVLVTPDFLRAGDQWVSLAFFWFLVAIPATGLVVLLCWRSISLRGLRVMELIALGLLVAASVFDAHRMLANNRELAIFARLGEVVVSIPPYTWQLYYPDRSSSLPPGTASTGWPCWSVTVW